MNIGEQGSILCRLVLEQRNGFFAAGDNLSFKSAVSKSAVNKFLNQEFVLNNQNQQYSVLHFPRLRRHIARKVSHAGNFCSIKSNLLSPQSALDYGCQCQPRGWTLGSGRLTKTIGI